MMKSLERHCHGRDRGRNRSHGRLADRIADIHSAVHSGRPRDPAVDQAILQAAKEILAETGFEGMTIEAVAHRAGVGKPAIYRRWPSKRDLVVRLLEQIADRPEMPGAGTVRERLAAFLSDWCQRMKAGNAVQSFSSLIGEMHRDPELRESVMKAFVTVRKRKMVAVLREGIASGEIQAGVDVEMIVDMLFGAVISRSLITNRLLTPAFGRQIVDMVFSGCCGQDVEAPHSEDGFSPP